MSEVNRKLTNHPPGHNYQQSGPRRCNRCKAPVYLNTMQCKDPKCGGRWEPSKRRRGPRYQEGT